MNEIIAAIIGLVATIVGVIITSAYYRGVMKTQQENTKQEIDAIHEQMEELKKETDKIDALHERVASISRDHTHLEEGLSKMTEVCYETKHSIGILNTTLSGLQQLLQNIFDGKLKMGRQ